MISRFSAIRSSFRRIKEFYSQNKDKIIENAKLFVTIFCIVYTVEDNLISYTFTIGPSMLPTIPNEPSLVILDKFSYKFLKRPYVVGDIITLKCPTTPSKSLCKRVVLSHSSGGKGFLLPKHHVWVEGDNKNNSFDSRHFGPISEALITSRALFMIKTSYPFFSFFNEKQSIKSENNSENRENNRECEEEIDES